jgi:phage-related minor tail protein
MNTPLKDGPTSNLGTLGQAWVDTGHAFKKAWDTVTGWL